jgi:hypothetical protein
LEGLLALTMASAAPGSWHTGYVSLDCTDEDIAEKSSRPNRDTYGGADIAEVGKNLG